MAFPNIGTTKEITDKVGANNAKRYFGNESRNMDKVFGSDLNKGYPKRDSQLQKFGNQIVGQSPGYDENQKKAGTMPPRDKKNIFEAGDERFDYDKGASIESRGGYGGGRGQFQGGPMQKAPSMDHLHNVGGERNEEMERMVSYLSDQVNSLEKMLYNESKRNKSYFETEKEKISKLESLLRLSEDNVNVSNNDLLNKLSILESRLQREEKARLDYRERLMNAEETQKELLNYIKAFQKQENSDFLQMREIIQDKLSSDQSEALKEREKAKTLFHEVVRLGEQQERTAEIIQNVNLGIETKIQTIEAKYQAAERALSQLTQKGEVGLNNLNEWNDKMEKKMQGLEANLYTLTREQLKDKDTIAKLEGINAKLSEDLSQLLQGLNQDYQQKLEAKVTEMVNRIVTEHEERVKQHDEFKNQVEMRDQLQQERSQYEREEMREKYESMDSLVRAEFQRKDEAIRTLHSIIETQVKQLTAQIKQEEINRGQFEHLIKGDFLKFQDDIRRDFDNFKHEQTTTTEKLTEMIKIEIDTRLASDIELKDHANMLAQNLQQDLDHLKEHIERQNAAFAKDLREISQESAERANQLSRYIDQEVKTLNDVFAKKYEKLKVLFAKFGEQFKNHLLNTEAFRKETMIKVQELEQAIEINKEEMQIMFQTYEKRMDDKFKDERDYIENMMQNNNATWDDKINKIKEMVDSDVDILKEAIDNNRSIFSNKLQSVMDLIDNYHRNNSQNLMKILGDIDAVRKFIDNLKKDITELSNTVAEDIISVRSYVEVELLNERTLRAELIQEIYERLTTKLNDANSAINQLRVADSRIEKTISGMEKKYDDRFHKFADQMADTFSKLTNLDENYQAFKEQTKEETVAIVARMTSDYVMVSSDTKILFEELKKLTVVVSKENTKTNLFQDKIADYIVDLGKESTNLRKTVEEDFGGIVESKIQTALERIKKENQQSWEKTLNYVKTDFKDVEKKINLNIPAKDKLNELATYQDLYAHASLRPVNK